MTALIASRYEPLEVVGHGAQGEVVRAWDHRHDRQVALKIRSLVAGEGRQDVVEEAGVLLGLAAHPRLPVVREDFFDADRYCIVMEWVAGTTLAARLADAPEGLDLDEVLGYLAQVAEALDHLHAQVPPVVHGDVKPANVLVDESGRAVLVDFGISRRVGASAPTLAGTRGYVAPELALGQAPSPAADVFSLAATAFALLAGHPPRPGARPSWRRIAAGRARQVEFALRRGLALDPTRRPPSAGALVAALAGEASGPTNLPVELTSFVGRRGALAEVSAALGANRVLTLTGPGGVGKTRLARQVAAEALGDYPDGAFLVELASLADPTLVAEQVLNTLGTEREPTMAALDALLQHLANRRLLLVLDNCEHLASVGPLVETLLRSCSHLRVLATSRQALGIAAEARWAVSPLGVPAPEEIDVATLAASEAVQLFVERASQARATFAVTDDNAAAVAQLCRSLDGIPLAIELAAARIGALSVSELARRLDDRFRLLAAGPRTAPQRHQTLRATVEWSYDALTTSERLLFERLSVFAGGFDVEAAGEVCAGEGVAEEQVSDVLTSLVDKSLVGVAESETGTSRYDLLETLRQFGAERLVRSGSDRTVRRLHLRWVMGMAKACASAYGGPQEPTWMERMNLEQGNVRAALGWAISAEPGTALELTATMGFFWGRNDMAEGRRWVTAALAACPDPPPELRALALRRAGRLAQLQYDIEVARPLLGASLEAFRQLGDKENTCSLLEFLCEIALGDGDHALCRALVAECQSLCIEIGDQHLMAESVGALGVLTMREGDLPRAKPLLDAALAGVRQLGLERCVAERLLDLGEYGITCGDIRGAQVAYEESLDLHRRHRSGRATSFSLIGLGAVATCEGDFDRSTAYYEEALVLSRKLGARDAEHRALVGLGVAALRRGDAAAARSVLVEALHIEPPRVTQPRHLESLGSTEVVLGDCEQAAVLFAAADGLRAAMGTPVPVVDRSLYERDLEFVRQRLGPAVFDAAWSRGRVMSRAELSAAADLMASSSPAAAAI